VASSVCGCAAALAFVSVKGWSGERARKRDPKMGVTTAAAAASAETRFKASLSLVMLSHFPSFGNIAISAKTAVATCEICTLEVYQGAAGAGVGTGVGVDIMLPRRKSPLL
jgi:hypothetical protein